MINREITGWQPEWNSAFCGWATNFIRKNKWRCDSAIDFEDLLQDAYLTFRRVKASYPRVTEPKHFMALFKTAMRNEMFDRARYRQEKQSAILEMDSEAFDYLSERIEGESNAGPLLALLDELPSEAKLVLAELHNDETLVKLREKRPQSKLAVKAGLPKKRENLNDKLCRILNIPKKLDVVGILREALTK